MNYFLLKKALILVLAIFSLPLFAQNKSVVSGLIINGESGDPLPYASVTLKNIMRLAR